MANAVQTQVTAHKNGTVTCMARVENAEGTAITQASVSTITYSAYLLDEDYPENRDTRTAITGHTAVALTKTACVYDTNQTGNNWSRDSTGYNFRHEIDVSTNALLETAGRKVLLQFTATPVSGQVIVWDYVVDVL